MTQTIAMNCRRIFTSASLLAVLGFLCGCTDAPLTDYFALAESYQRVIASLLRTEQDRRMDDSRHPAELLSFTQVKPGMKVLDVSAGRGYTTQLLAIAVGADGMVWAQAQRLNPELTKRLAEQPQSNVTVLQRPFDDPIAADAGKLDLITLVLNYHDIISLPIDRDKMNARLFDALKPGGRLVIVDHSGRSGTGVSEVKTLHRIEETVVLNEVTKAGFVFDARGDFMRNPADSRAETSNNPKVPTDKFALRFKKPQS